MSWPLPFGCSPFQNSHGARHHDIRHNGIRHQGLPVACAHSGSNCGLNLQDWMYRGSKRVLNRTCKVDIDAIMGEMDCIVLTQV